VGVGVSRFARPKEPAATSGTPVWVWVVYALGLLAGGIIALSLAFAGVVYLSSDDEFSVSVSTPALVLWSALVVLAAGTLVWRRRGGGR
jgi:hypothetical protein